ncbi:MAG: hypothetical protein IBX71_09835 [Candidatus Desulforudis sp.]|nr:hypothetical protein [Desulforudis sp.]
MKETGLNFEKGCSATGIGGSINVNPNIQVSVDKAKVGPLTQEISVAFRVPCQALPAILFRSSLPNETLLTIHITEACTPDVIIRVTKQNEEEILFRIPVDGSLVLLESDIHTIELECLPGEEGAACSGTLEGKIRF